MKTPRWFPTAAAAMAHVPVVALVMLWPQKSEPIPAPDFVSSDISHIQLPADFTDYTAKEPADCEIHGIRMRAEVVPFEYGLPASRLDPLLFPGAISTEPSKATRKKLFPHAERFVWGGCCLPVDSDWIPRTDKARIWICSDCERAETEWRRDFPKQVE